MAIAQKGIRIEPFIHKTDEQINSLPVMELDKIAKYYFNEWWRTLKPQDILLKDVEAIQKDFETYLKTKNLDNGQEV
jgi:hypothetical protein